MTRRPSAAAWARRWLRPLTLVFSLLCFAWVLWPLLRHGRELRRSVEGSALLGWVAGGMVLYALISVLLGLAWWWLGRVYGGELSARRGYAIWARSQWAKYLPGNAFHYVSRQVLGRRAGLSHAALVASGLLELGSLLIAALITALLGLGSGSTDWLPRTLPWAMALMVVVLCSWPVLDAMLRRWPKTAGRMADLPPLSLRRTWTLLAPAIVFHLLFFLATGGLLYALLHAGWETVPIAGERLLSLFAIAWLAGTVTVGAPAGVGVREAVLSLELAPLIGAPEASLLALALRLVTTGGDGVSALLGWLLASRETAVEPET